MADGGFYAGQREFGFPTLPVSRLRPGEIVVDLFAGGGGASTALEQALGRPVDLAINHNAWAVAMHAANHPLTTHLCQDVWEADPRIECAGKKIGWLHASPDCTHFSQARGGQPRDRAVRSLSWVMLRWAGTVRPRIVSFENVKEILKWGPLIAKRDRATKRCIRLTRVRSYTKRGKARYVTVQTIAARGARVPISQQFLIPDKRYEGRTWRRFTTSMHERGYTFETRRIKACDYGAGTMRERLFGVGRCDGEPICWPKPTHGPGRAHPYVTAADCIDWSIECPSIFTRSKPLADSTLRRIARGMQRYVLEAAEPFIVPNNTNNVPHPVSEPVPTITGANRGEIAATTLVQASHGEGSGATTRRGTGALDPQAPLGVICASGGTFALSMASMVQVGYGERPGQAPRTLDVQKPLGVAVAGGIKHALVSAALVKFRGDSAGVPVSDPAPTITSGAGASRPAGAAHALGLMTAFMAQAYGGGENGNPAPPRSVASPVSAITKSGSQQQLVAASLVTLRGTNIGEAATSPVRTLSAQGEHHAVVEYTLSQELQAAALRVGAFLAEQLELGDHLSDEQLLALVTVHVQGIAYVIVDIGLRMLRREELFAAQGFPKGYVIDRTADGRILSIARSVMMVGNSVSPPPLRAIAEANLDRIQEYELAEAA